ncbi:lipopolysaccharide biosynthesis protein [Modestobacter sp. VKM Ac-2984]|uniref:lipopolysaccharide biosynthesis protein n=1 Tax=Modestobacter sp. VKM Ac-2984 TaxID=3004138 RepID=UPI0022AA48C6|nr:lipopolysaccharide biosynthesis protein [Modestobacter sp. VKM Ac-2984]MCZ2817755.1 lipopolysaccharide biosynthesis protein [Modestobacter sp. VKM Ac-2984]
MTSAGTPPGPEPASLGGTGQLDATAGSVPGPPAGQLGDRAARGAVVTLAGQGVRIGVQVLSVVLLSRLLSPADYGLLAMTTVVIGIADIFRDLGLSTAAVQARVLTRGQRSNLFWINSAIGLGLALLVFAGAPLLAAVYGRPELTALTQVLCWTFVLNGIATQYRADLTRRLLFGRLVLADTVSPICGLAAALAAALAGAGFWALVVQQLVQYAVMMTMVLAAGRWLPGRPDRREPMSGLLRFGWHLVSTQLIGYAGNNIDTLVVGLRFGAVPLGLYNRAFQLLMTPLNQLRGPATQVALPVLSRLQSDQRAWSALLLRGQLALGHSLVVGLALVIGTATPLTEVFLGEQWSSVSPLLRLLAVAGVFQTLALVSYWVYLSRGLTRHLLHWSFVQVAVKLVCIGIGSTGGVVGVAIGYAAAPAVLWPLSFWWLSRRATIPVADLLRGAGRVLAVSATVAAAGWAASTATVAAGPVLSLLAGVAGGLVGYAAVVVPVPSLRRDALSVLTVVRRAIARQGAPRGTGQPEPGAAEEPGDVPVGTAR